MTPFQSLVCTALPEDAVAALVGRVAARGRRPVGGRDPRSTAFDISARSRPCATCANRPSRRRAGAAPGERIGAFDAHARQHRRTTRDRDRPWLLAPIDLQAIKAAGVTFAVSMLERVIEERARGNLDAAEAIRADVDAPGRRRFREAQAGLAGGDPR